MNYDLFIPPHVIDRAAVVPIGQSPRGSAAGTAEAIRPPKGTETVELTGRPLPEEVFSSDENTAQRVREAVELVNRFFTQSPVDLNLSIDEETESLVIKLIERDSRKVIRQVPPDEILNLRRHLQELLGVIFDETV